MKRMKFDPSDYTETGEYGSRGGTVGFLASVFLLVIVSQASYYYFININIPIISSGLIIDIIAIVITFFEVGVCYYIKNRNKDLAKYSESKFDSSSGCWFLIVLLLCSFHINKILLYEVNGRFDFHEGTKRKVKLFNKNSRAPGKVKINYHYYFEVEDWNNSGRRVEFEVSKSLFNKISGSIIEFETKPGLLGFEHLSSDVTVAEK